mgnify:CR=1 FL=1
MEFINTGKVYGTAQQGFVVPFEDVRVDTAEVVGSTAYLDFGTLVFILDGTDPLAPANCVGPDRTWVSGWPYDDFDEVVVPAGATLSQTALFFYPNQNPSHDGLRTFSFWLEDVTATEVWADFSGPGLSPVSLRLQPNAGLNVNPPYPKWTALFGPAFVPPYFSTGITFAVTLRPVGGSVTVRRWTSALPVGGLCDPIARASWGGSAAHAGARLDADLMFGYETCPTDRFYADADGDGYGNLSRPFEFCSWNGFMPAGFVPAPSDCDDTDASRHPGAAELCNGLDDDCDGFTDAQDPGLTAAACEVTDGVCAGSTRPASLCVAGGWASCGPSQYGSSFETTELSCDGLDNDCDGVVDEVVLGPLCVNQLGVCAGTRTQVCSEAQWTACGPSDLPDSWQPDETSCDGLDNDCDGAADADDGQLPVPACELQLGVCAGAVRPRDYCTASGWQACDGRQYGERYQPIESLCDGLDNDCDGQRDFRDADLILPACELQLGVCAGSRHAARQCDVSGWEICQPSDYGQLYELKETRCDGWDNDCDGLIDETCSGTPAGCGSDGICSFHALGCGAAPTGSFLLFAAALSVGRSCRRRVAQR